MLRKKSQFYRRLLPFMFQSLFLLSRMRLMAFPYLLSRSQDYCFKAQAILMRRLVVPWSGLKSGRKFRAGRGQ